jgi:U3 small nucleolar RNA-associated protein 25
MTSLTEVKLLTLLNVSAVKRPRPLDVPGGHRGSPSLSRTQSPTIASKSSGEHSKANGDGQVEGVRQAKRKRSVVFGGEVGPSGSSFQADEKGTKSVNGKTTTKSLSDNGGLKTGGAKGKVNGHANGDVVQYNAANGHAPEAEPEEESDYDERGESSASGMFVVCPLFWRSWMLIGDQGAQICSIYILRWILLY